MRTTTIRPGLLVALKSTIKGNVRYSTTDIEPEHIERDGTKRATWETRKVVENPTEHEEAVRVRAKARAFITAVCSPSAFGLLCPDSRAADLDTAIRNAREACQGFNASAGITEISLYVIAGKVNQDDEQAIRAINSEIRELMEAMGSGLVALDVEKVRDAATKAKALGQMLSPEAEGRMRKAIEAARQAARQIVKAGEGVAVAIDKQTLRLIQESRTMFLDLDDAQEMQAPETTGRAIELNADPVPPAPRGWTEVEAGFELEDQTRAITAAASPNFTLDL